MGCLVPSPKHESYRPVAIDFIDFIDLVWIGSHWWLYLGSCRWRSENGKTILQMNDPNIRQIWWVWRFGYLSTNWSLNFSDLYITIPYNSLFSKCHSTYFNMISIWRMFVFPWGQACWRLPAGGSSKPAGETHLFKDFELTGSCNFWHPNSHVAVPNLFTHIHLIAFWDSCYDLKAS